MTDPWPGGYLGQVQRWTWRRGEHWRTWLGHAVVAGNLALVARLASEWGAPTWVAYLGYGAAAAYLVREIVHLISGHTFTYDTLGDVVAPGLSVSAVVLLPLAFAVGTPLALTGSLLILATIVT